MFQWICRCSSKLEHGNLKFQVWCAARPFGCLTSVKEMTIFCSSSPEWLRARVLTWKRSLCLEKGSIHFWKAKISAESVCLTNIRRGCKKAHGRWERVDYWWVLHWKRLCVRLCISGIQRRRISGRPFHRAQHTASRLLALSLALPLPRIEITSRSSQNWVTW
jgi:hypothetical protein